MSLGEERLKVIARLGLVLTLAALGGAALLLWVNRSTTSQSEPLDLFNPYLAGLGFGVVGAVIAARRPRHAVGWLLMTIALAYAIPALAMEAAIWRLRESAAAAGIAIIQGNVAAAVQVSAIAAVAIFFPQGRLPGRRWMIAIGLLAVSAALTVVSEPFVGTGPRFRDPGLAYEVVDPGDSLFATGEVVEGDRFREVNTALAAGNRAAAEGSAWLAPPLLTPGGDMVAIVDPLQFIASSLALLVLAASALRLIVVGLRSTGTTRVQMKWLSYAVMVAIALVAISALPFAYVADLHLSAAVVLSVGVPWAIGIAITRHGLYEIDRIVNRTVVYGAVAAVLAGLFAGGAALTSTLLPTDSSDLGIAASTLAVAGLFNPLRRRVQATVNRRFYRTRYDPQQIADDLSTRLRDRTDPSTVGDVWIHAVSRTLQPQSVGMWLNDPPPASSAVTVMER